MKQDWLSVDNVIGRAVAGQANDGRRTNRVVSYYRFHLTRMLIRDGHLRFSIAQVYSGLNTFAHSELMIRLLLLQQYQ